MSDDLNKDWEMRDKIIFGRTIAWQGDEEGRGGIERFEGLTFKELKLLLQLNFLDPEDRQNNSPPIWKFMEFMEQHPGTTAHGHVVSPTRADYRISIEGLEYKGQCSTEMQLEFIKLFRGADSCDTDDTSLYCWYD